MAGSQRDREKARDTFAQLNHWIEDAMHQDPATAVKVADKVRAEAIDTSLGRQRRGFEAAIKEDDELLAGIRRGQEANRHLRELSAAAIVGTRRPTPSPVV